MTTPHFVVDLSNPFLQWRPIVVVLHLNLKRINCGFISFIRRGINPIGFLYKTDPTDMSMIDIWMLRSFLLIEQCPGSFSQCDNISGFLRPELQRAGDSPRSK